MSTSTANSSLNHLHFQAFFSQPDWTEQLAQARPETRSLISAMYELETATISTGFDAHEQGIVKLQYQFLRNTLRLKAIRLIKCGKLEVPTINESLPKDAKGTDYFHPRELENFIAVDFMKYFAMQAEEARLNHNGFGHTQHLQVMGWLGNLVNYYKKNIERAINTIAAARGTRPPLFDGDETLAGKSRKTVEIPQPELSAPTRAAVEGMQQTVDQLQHDIRKLLNEHGLPEKPTPPSLRIRPF